MSECAFSQLVGRLVSPQSLGSSGTRGASWVARLRVRASRWFLEGGHNNCPRDQRISDSAESNGPGPVPGQPEKTDRAQWANFEGVGSDLELGAEPIASRLISDHQPWPSGIADRFPDRLRAVRERFGLVPVTLHAKIDDMGLANIRTELVRSIEAALAIQEVACSQH
jgi:hypothetical protein